MVHFPQLEGPLDFILVSRSFESADRLFVLSFLQSVDRLSVANEVLVVQPSFFGFALDLGLFVLRDETLFAGLQQTSSRGVFLL